MKRDEILKTQAGRTIDAWIAQEIMGFEYDGAWFVWPNKEDVKVSLDGLPHYSTSMADAWNVVRKLPNGLFRLELSAMRATVDFTGYSDSRVEVEGIPEDVAPLAICRAALLSKLLGNEKEISHELK